MTPEEFGDKNHPKWEEYKRRTSINERVALIHRDWGAGNTIDLTRNLTKHSNPLRKFLEELLMLIKAQKNQA